MEQFSLRLLLVLQKVVMEILEKRMPEVILLTSMVMFQKILSQEYSVRILHHFLIPNYIKLQVLAKLNKVMLKY